MARSITVRLGGETNIFTYANIDRERLYGRNEQQVVDADGRRCHSARRNLAGAGVPIKMNLAQKMKEE